MKQINQIAKTTYGKRKLDAEAYEAQEAAKTRTVGTSNVVYGKRKAAAAEGATSTPPAQTNPFAAGEADGNRNGQITVAELATLLEKDPALLDLAIDAEFRREKPRASALKVLAQFEAAREGGPRERVLKLLGGQAAAAEGDGEEGGGAAPQE